MAIVIPRALAGSAALALLDKPDFGTELGRCTTASAVFVVVEQWMLKLYRHSGIIYKDGVVPLTGPIIAAVWRVIVSHLRHCMPWSMADQDRIAMVFTYWRKSPEAENVRSCIELEKAGGPRISCTYVQDQIRKTYECGSDAMVVATLGSTGQTRVLNGEDLRMLAELVLERFRAEAGIPQMPKLQTELPGYGQETEVEEQEQEEGNTCMQVMMDKAMVVATGMEMMKAHQQLLADTCAANVKAIEAYMAAATENLVKTGSVGELKAVEIKVPECKVKAYEDCLRKVRHMAGSEVPSTSEVMFLLAEARDVTPIAVKKLTVTLA